MSGNQPDPAALEWDGNRLYVHRNGKRLYVGEVIRQSYGGGYDILVRGSRENTFHGEQRARQQLEAYAKWTL